MSTSGSILGNSVLRKEDKALLTGDRPYFADVDAPNAAHIVFVRSTSAHADIVELDISGALDMPGVLAVHTSETLHIEPEAAHFMLDGKFTRPHLAEGRVRFVGDIVAAVVAESLAQAVDAAEMVVVDYEPRDAVIDLEAAAEDGSPLVRDDCDDNIIFTASTNFESDVLADADVVVTANYLSQRLAGVPIEPMGCLAVPDDGHMTLWIPSQNPVALADQIATSVGVDREHLRVVAPAVGGGFGSKSGYYIEYGLTGRIAKQLSRPVRWTSSRSEDMLALTHGRAQVIDISLGISSDGHIVGLRADLLADAGAHPGLGGMLVTFTQRMMHGPYKIPAVAFRGRAVLTNTTRVAAYRGAGRPEAAQSIERVMDLGASAIGMDPAEFRRMNFIAPEAFPLVTSTGAEYDCGEYERALDLALEASGYSSLRAEQNRRRVSPETRQLGIGVSSYVEVTNPPGINAEWGRVEVNDDGSATLTVGTSSHGQGHDTSFSMIVSDVLGIPMENLTLRQSDTDTVSQGLGTMGSRSLQAGGSALQAASQEVLAKAKRLAAHLLEADPDDIVSADDGVQVAGVPARALTWQQLVAASKDPNGRPADMDEGLGHELVFDGAKSTYPFGSHVSVVEVDVETGGVEVLRHVAVDDCGKIINPMIVRGQQHGGIAQGIAQALFEWVRYDEDGNPLSSTLMDYLIPSATEFPSFEACNTETPSPNNPLGAKGVGESGTIGSTPAVQSAVIDALSHLGVTHIDMPLSPERVWLAIQEAQSSTRHSDQGRIGSE